MSELQIVYDDVLIDVGNLPTKDCIAVSSKIDTSRLNGFRIVKTEYWIDYEGKTASQGPLMVGMSPNHSASEVEEAIEADPQASTEEVTLATARRPIFPLEMIPQSYVAQNADGFGAKGVIRPKWSIIEGKALFWWVYNMDAIQVDTGLLVHIFAKHYGVWLRD